MRFPLAVAFAAVAALTACAQNAKDFTPKTDQEKELYTLGILISRQIESFEFTDQELAIVKAGVDHGARGVGKLKDKDMEALVPKLQELQGKRVEAAAAKAKTDGEAHVTKAAAEQGATKLASGAVYKSTTEGSGASPKATDMVKVHYEGKLLSGKVFDSSHERGEVAEFPLNGVIPCWTEGLQQMKVGGKAKLVCPASTAYGEGGRPGIPGNSTLLFDVELIEILPPQPAMEGAAPGAAAPAHAH